jgi:hypothetical protein
MLSLDKSYISSSAKAHFKDAVIEPYGLIFYIQSLTKFCILISIKETAGFELPCNLLSNYQILTWHDWPTVIAVKKPNLTDLKWLRKYSSAIFLNSVELIQNDPAFDWELVDEAVNLGYRVFYDQKLKRSFIPGSEPLDFLEFIVSDDLRLKRFPRYTATASSSGALRNQDVVFVFDLLQDFEVLKPIVEAHANVVGSRFFSAIVTDRVLAATIWPTLEAFLKAYSIQVYYPKNTLEAAACLPSQCVLFTASESSANGHKFSHELCLLASPNVLKCTFQHGYENVGLRHHMTHNMSAPKGIRYASDIIFTWTHQEQLVDAHPSDLAKCLPVGVIKALTVDAIDARENLVNQITDWDFTEGDRDENDTRPANVLLCENLHSVRFKDPMLSDAYKQVMYHLQHSPYADLKVRSHPGKKLLEKDPTFASFKFLGGELTCAQLVKYDFLLSPPSTIILDAVLSGVSVAIWSATKNSGDLENYKTLPNFENAEDLIDLLVINKEQNINIVFNNLRWAAKNTAAFDGTKYVVSRLTELLT